MDRIIKNQSAPVPISEPLTEGISSGRSAGHSSTRHSLVFSVGWQPSTEEQDLSGDMSGVSHINHHEAGVYPVSWPYRITPLGGIAGDPGIRYPD